MVLTAAPKTPVADYKQFLAHVAARGGQLSLATPGTASTNHLAMELLALKAGFKFTHVPYKGAGPALNDLLASQVEMMLDQIPPSLPHIKDGRIKAIAVTVPKRIASLPDVPTLDELGIKGFEASTFTGLFGPAGMPEAVLAMLAAAHAKAMADPKLRERYATLGVDVLDMSREAFSAFVKADFEKWKGVVEAAKITAD
jgi:tripartite-type tricarboxylate transporter receptor subunit TctC